MRQAELNSVDVGERYTEAKTTTKCGTQLLKPLPLVQTPETVKRNYQAAKEEGDKDAIANYGQMVDAIDKFMENRGMADAERPRQSDAAIKGGNRRRCGRSHQRKTEQAHRPRASSRGGLSETPVPRTKPRGGAAHGDDEAGQRPSTMIAPVVR